MLTCRELALFLAASAARTRPQITATTRKLIEGAAKDAQELIGHELDKWAPLADRTVKEKERLGYTGHVSSTDPLLRTGALRRSIKSGVEQTGETIRGVVGSEEKVALYQEMGTSRIPPRPFIATAMSSLPRKADRPFGYLAVELLTPGIR